MVLDFGSGFRQHVFKHACEASRPGGLLSTHSQAVRALFPSTGMDMPALAGCGPDLRAARKCLCEA